MEYLMVSLSKSTHVVNVELNNYAVTGWTVHTATQYYILLERKSTHAS